MHQVVSFVTCPNFDLQLLVRQSTASFFSTSSRTSSHVHPLLMQQFLHDQLRHKLPPPKKVSAVFQRLPPKKTKAHLMHVSIRTRWTAIGTRPGPVENSRTRNNNNNLGNGWCLILWCTMGDRPCARWLDWWVWGNPVMGENATMICMLNFKGLLIH